MNISSFSLSTNRKINFKDGCINELADEIIFYGKNTAVFTGGSSLKKSGKLDRILDSLNKAEIKVSIFSISAEPSPETVDKITEKLRGSSVQSIVAIGGGSVIDTAKAVSAMLCEEGSVCDFLEGIGDRSPSGKKIPFIAVPTTAGTGSEATYNAVLSRVGKDGFKKSLRHKNYTPDLALIDPELYSGCPASIAASSGMDALSQLIESYLSIKSIFYTDLLITNAVEGVFEALPIITADKNSEDICDTECNEAWRKMAYGSYISGLSLANCGYCIVHGIAGPLGGFFDIPHGAICGTLLAAGMRATIDKLEKEDPESPALLKFAKLGYLAAKSEDILPKEARQRFIQIVEMMTENMGIKKLSEYGITEADLPKIVEASSNKNSPVSLDKEDILGILQSRL